ncbi:2-phosphoxylose phosphatase 1 [Chironomus tepperi]|uniref:2-phosphoxylose phosphatase 1 n=1 Tax=Chironomus tepperi TaxID=113505 RepID=UPI00391F9DF6
MILREFLRLSSKHRTIYFYLLLWILLIFLGMYKYVSSDSTNSAFLPKSFYSNKVAFETKRKDTEKIEKYRQRYCNNINTLNLTSEDEGGFIEGWTLQGVILLIRHGDRASLVHVRDIHSIDCSYEHDQNIIKYRNYLLNSSLMNPNNGNNNGHVSWNRQGPFHGFPLLPADLRACLLGQLTYKGISQLLHIGELMRHAYANALDLLRKPVPIPPPRTSNNTENHQQFTGTDEIVVYSTRYRRTFQSAMALLFNLLPNDRWHNLQVQESHSLAFCFNDCACANAEHLKKMLSRESSRDYTNIPAVASLVNLVGSSLLQIQDAPVFNPLDVRDALLMYVCHNQELPCQHNSHQSTAQPQHEIESNDIIDLDESQHSPDSTTNDGDDDDMEEAINDRPTENCVEDDHIEALFSYTNSYEVRESNNRNKIIERALRAYGLIRNIVGLMLKMISGDKTKFVLYSCHDQTLQFVLAALGLIEQSSYIPYATRFAFEVYRSDKDNQFYYRAVYNGKDVTRLISFCIDGKSLRVKRGRAQSAFLCPIENIIRFIHDDYFSMMNATNFKDACLPQTDRNSYF